jgi:hypothetical protein
MSAALFIECIAAIFGIVGTLLLATKGRFAGWGFVAFLGSNAGWLVFSYSHAHWFMFAQQVGFTLSSLLGIWVWVVRPWVAELLAPFDHDLNDGGWS